MYIRTSNILKYMAQIKTDKGEIVHFDGYPNECPFCHKAIIPHVEYAYDNLKTQTLEVLMSCPNSNCCKSFIGYYPFFNTNSSEYNGKVTFGALKEKDFPEDISIISPSFVEIYNQAFFAEQHDLSQICGVGYRKSLEFLIKDYIISKNPDETEKIQKKMLGQCISENVDDNKIKTVAKRAAWLGNDETHYVRKWQGKDLQDLKRLIDLTLHWIEMELLTNEIENDMPE